MPIPMTRDRMDHMVSLNRAAIYRRMAFAAIGVRLRREYTAQARRLLKLARLDRECSKRKGWKLP